MTAKSGQSIEVGTVRSILI